ncbi:MAG: PqqD family protein [Thermoanaerobaculales bacterium]|nr:PqqD family protein [Thermoanaerobaculales bacterium]
MDLDTVLMPNGDFVFRDIGGETILVPVRAGVSELDSLFALNEVGAVVWKGVEARSSVQEIVSVVRAEFEIEPAVAEKDVLEFLDVLVERNLIRHAEV